MHMHNISTVYCLCKVSESFSKSSGTVDFPVYTLSKHKQNAYLTANRKKKRLISQSCHFVKAYFFVIKLFHANVQCVYIVYAKYQNVSVKALVRADFPVYALSVNH